MRALLYEQFAAPPEVRTVPDPAPDESGVVIKVKSTGLCRSDWHGWMGHDPDIRLPHVPGHELAGVIEAVGKNVSKWKRGDRVTVPFVGGCGVCPQCLSGNHQVCDDQFQPGFTHWGSFAEYVAVGYADINLVGLPDDMDFASAASLGCRFVTSFRALVDRGGISAGEWVAVHGCGGVGLSAVMIGSALGANVIGIDISDEKLSLARSLGAVHTVNSRNTDPVEAVRDITKGGVHLSLDALGHPETCRNSIENLRKRGRHIQVGLLLGDQKAPSIPMDRVIADELEIYGSHGIQAHRYDAVWSLAASGKVNPALLLGRRIGLTDAAGALMAMDDFDSVGMTIIDPEG